MSLFAEDVRNEFAHQTIQIMKDQLIGTGAYGSVCHANIDQLSCAAKTVHPALLQMRDPGSGHILQKFHAECEIMSRLRHPNIVQYIGTATDPDTRTPVLLMELLDCSLTQFLEETENPLPYYEQINFSHDIALACAYLHYNNVIHRDLSANNVLLLGRIRAKVGDFGMARLLNRSVASPELTMCPGAQVYMPPEALTDPAVYNAKVDVFSMGVVFIQIMTKCFPIPKERFREENRFGETVRIIVPEVERREQHIRRINAAHPLLLIAKQCLQDNEIRRPTSDHLCQQIMQLKLSQTYHESKQDVQQARQRGQRQDSQESLQQLNADLVRELEEKELLNEGQQQENRHLIEQLQQKERELQEARSRNAEIEQMLTQEQRRLESLQTQFSRIRMWEHGPQGRNSEHLQWQLTEIQADNSQLQRRLHELQHTAQHLQERNSELEWRLEHQLADTATTPGKQYTAVLYTPSYIKNIKKEWNAVFAVCPMSSTNLTTGLRKLICDMFEAPFTASSVCVTFDLSNTLTLNIPKDASTDGYDIACNVTPPTIGKDEVDIPDTEEKRRADDAYPPRIFLTIRPSPTSQNLLKCSLLLEGVEAKRTLILSTPTLIKPRHNSVPEIKPPFSHHRSSDIALQSLRLGQDVHGLEYQSMQQIFTGHVAVTTSARNNQLFDSEMEHPALDQHVVLARVMNLCGSQVPQDWNTLGIQLGLMPGDINTISATGHMDPIRRIQDMFSAWLRVDPEPTWRKLLKALRTPTVKQDVLAYNIQHELTKPK